MHTHARTHTHTQVQNVIGYQMKMARWCFLADSLSTFTIHYCELPEENFPRGAVAAARAAAMEHQLNRPMLCRHHSFLSGGPDPWLHENKEKEDKPGC